MPDESSTELILAGGVDSVQLDAGGPTYAVGDVLPATMTAAQRARLEARGAKIETKPKGRAPSARTTKPRDDDET